MDTQRLAHRCMPQIAFAERPSNLVILELDVPRSPGVFLILIFGQKKTAILRLYAFKGNADAMATVKVVSGERPGLVRISADFGDDFLLAQCRGTHRQWPEIMRITKGNKLGSKISVSSACVRSPLYILAF
jgi:hypothetical protein